MRVLIAPDKFAGTLDAAEAAAAMAAGWRRSRPSDEVISLPLADGGPGTVDALAASGAGRRRSVRTTDPLGRPITASWWEATDGTAVMEVAAACGLHLLEARERDPLRASSSGLGVLLAAARDAGAQRIVVGLGGTATVDGGSGAMRHLGATFEDAGGRPVRDDVMALTGLANVTPLPRPLPPVRLASDVRNPLLGPEGAAAVFAPQKGADAQAVAVLEGALTRLADVVERQLPGGPWRDRPGAGAAGGLGFAMLAWADAEMISGAEFVGAAVGLERAIAAADVVITGEGGLDAQTAQGKVPEHVRRLARAAGRSVLAIAGHIEDGAGDGYDDHAELGASGLDRPHERCREVAAEVSARWR